jgi:hypothetical protein
MNREKSEAKFICIPDCHAFKMDLWCAGLQILLTDKSIVTTDLVCCLKKLKVVETTDKIGCDKRFVGQGNK